MELLNKRINERIKKMRKEQLQRPNYLSKVEFTEYIYEVKDPISNEVLKVHNLNYEEYKKLPYEMKGKCKKVFDENKYKEHKKSLKEQELKYNEIYKKIKKEEIDKLNLDEDKVEIIDRIVESVIDNFGRQNKDDIISFEKELIYLFI